MSAYHELVERLPFDPSEREGVVGARRVPNPRIVPVSFGLGGIVAVILATGAGIAPPADFGAALFFGLVTAVFTRGLLIAWHALATGGWRRWRNRTLNAPAADGISAVGGIALTFFLANGGGGVGPIVAPITAILIGLFAGILLRAILGLLRWP